MGPRTSIVSLMVSVLPVGRATDVAHGSDRILRLEEPWLLPDSHGSGPSRLLARRLLKEINGAAAFGRSAFARNALDFFIEVVIDG